VGSAEQRRRWQRLLLAAASLALSVIAAELLLRAIAPAPPGFRVWPPHLDWTFHPAPDVMPGVSGASRFSTNGLGLRGDEWSSGDSYRILAIGGSTTESLYLDDREAWPRLLQDRLNAARGGSEVWVGNAGKSGLSSRHHVIQVMRLLEQHPVDAVIVMVGVNDLHNRLSRDAAFLPIDQEPKSEFRRLYLSAFSLWPARPAPIWEPVALQRRWARAHQRLERPEHVTQDDAGRNYVRWRQHRQQASALRSELPDLEPALLEYARNLHTIVDLARRHSVRLVLATQPVMWHAGLSAGDRALLWLGGVGAFQSEPGHEYYTVEALADGMARYNSVLLEVCAARGIGCADLAAALPRDPSVFYDDCHLNEGGARQVAGLLAEHFRQSGLLLTSATAARGG
jgi:lysophospholipase L1-like esterase